MTGHFTGRHMAIIMVSFFAVVVGVNLIMARYAVSSFGGPVVANSYVASQNFNRWLAEADVQAKLGWKPVVTLDPARRLVVAVSKDGVALAGLAASGIAIHPLGQAPSVPLTFAPAADATLQAAQALPPGRWRVQLVLRRGADTLKLSQPVQ